ncbi:hypothetical protein Nham_0140 [Nitrobacter hamburgensis X14]|uniref:Uncharacterized protein n=1 Tax=Nitrobacter hamburgensis (strain DSM 10229 / NCIMB 13809 / X14) TaxID=323097 RepID=Q1QRV6_NITHX|nr:hypothetical protein [Nitrobacter hamburgensis]ABE61041.1 hypothetical protein Nham_0140 [Nitrobacter hamburgensis X14]
MPHKLHTELPSELEPVREAACRALGSVKPATASTPADKDFLFDAKRTNAGRKLPAQHLVYFVLVDLLGYRDLGRSEKLAWSIPIDFNGRAFLIEHRKFGVGVFAADLDRDEADAQQIVNHIHKAVKAARPFFDWLAARAIDESAINVTNKSASLFDRFVFLRDGYHLKADDAEARKDERIVKTGKSIDGGEWQTFSFPASRLRTEAKWLGLAAIEAFFSWTEHVLIHVGILRGVLTSANEVTSAAEANWSTKFKLAFDLADEHSKKLYDELLVVRKELRNFAAHGSFGKLGEAFHFHSSAGAVPVLLPDPIGSRKFTLGEPSPYDLQHALRTIEKFIVHLWEGPRAPARIYIQEYELPLILTMTHDGTYRSAMTSIEEMTLFADHLSGQIDRAGDMDW